LISVRSISIWLTVSIPITATSRVTAQAIPKPDYVTYLPREILLPVQATTGNGLFHLFGDTTAPDYRDEVPRDGIDDARESWFRALAVRFAPWLVRNTVDFPMDFRRFVEGGDASTLFIDALDLSQAHPRLVSTETVEFGRLADAPCQSDALGSSTPVVDTTPDCRLLQLVGRFAPEPARVASLPRPDLDLHYVMYFDFPGEDPPSWNREFEGPVRGSIARKYIGYAKSFVHPFVQDVPGSNYAATRYELVLQYWFFYPYNDAGNTHEGDWEHINVVVTRRADGATPWSAAVMKQILEQPALLDELVIRRVEYYFHHWVFIADYMTPDVYAVTADWEREVKSLREERVGEREIWRQIRRQAYLDEAETKLNLHPIVFIGGDNRGLQQLLTASSRLGRASHGSYPFPGLYKDVGPQHTGELVHTPWDIFRSVPDSEATETDKVVRFDIQERLEIVPDWERVLPLVRSDPVVRRRWAWLVLPIRFGYPATRSSFAGIVRYAETGNGSVVAPAYNGGWNRAGAASGYDRYMPHRLSSYFPASQQDNYRTGWGFWNLTLPTLVTLPPFDIAYRLISAPVRAADRNSYPAFFGSQDVPFRFVGVVMGVSSFRIPDAFLNLAGFPETASPFLEQALALAGPSDSVTVNVVNPTTDRVSAPYYGVTLFLGRRFTSENTLRHSNGGVRADVTFSTLPGRFPLTMKLDMWEYTGSVRYNIATGSLQPFVKGGYGLSWYRITDAKFNGQSLGDGTTRWVRRPDLFHNLLPNTWHIGGGLEFIPIRSVSRVDVGFRADFTIYSHRLGLKADNLLLAQDAHVTRVHGGIGTILSF
jgi:hypothetical protein